MYIHCRTSDRDGEVFFCRSAVVYRCANSPFGRTVLVEKRRPGKYVKMPFNQRGQTYFTRDNSYLQCWRRTPGRLLKGEQQTVKRGHTQKMRDLLLFDER